MRIVQIRKIGIRTQEGLVDTTTMNSKHWRQEKATNICSSQKKAAEPGVCRKSLISLVRMACIGIAYFNNQAFQGFEYQV